ncbi:MAG TPA: hypothetical protein VMF70_07530 [Gemmatimonadales bacterium]|nr:hypothetical protein [Gemmatimonadales bacterium]
MMPASGRAIRLALPFSLACLIPAAAGAQTVTVPLSADAWIATDSIRFEPYLGRPSLYVNRGVALARNASLDNGTIELDMAATPSTTFLGAAFRAAAPRFSNVVFVRPGASGSQEAVQYGPAFNGVGTAWQVYHGEGANAVAVIPRERWVHLRIELDGPVARVYVDTATAPTLVVPRLAASGGNGLGVWAGAFGRGAYFSNIRYAAGTAPSAAAARPSLPPGTIERWELSEVVDAAGWRPTALPDLARLTWQRVEPEPQGFVLINRYRESPAAGLPTDSTGAILADSVMTGRIAGAKLVFARTTIVADRDGIRRLQYGYNNGVVVYANGRPLVFAMNPGGLRGGLGIMATVGDAVYLPLRRGPNEIVFAVLEVTGGWAFWARLDPA